MAIVQAGGQTKLIIFRHYVTTDLISNYFMLVKGKPRRASFVSDREAERLGRQKMAGCQGATTIQLLLTII